MDAKRQIMSVTKLFICLISVAFFSSQLTAQTEQVGIGTIIEASLSNDDVHTYQITLLEASIISIYVEALNDSFDPILSLLDGAGNAIISNDDYDYPRSSDALIQALVIPQTDTYTVQVRAFSGAAGSYRLAVLPGYDQTLKEDSITDQSNWAAINDSGTISTFIDSSLFIEVEGIAQSSTLIANHFPTALNAYYEATLNDITATTNWQVGLVFRYINPNLFYRLIMNNQGFWQLELVEDGEASIVQSWSTHPAIVPGETKFTLGVLTSDDSIDVIYNRQLIGTVYDNRILQAGGFGIAAITANALNSRVEISLDHALVTVPSKQDDQHIFPDTLVASNYTALAHNLERQQVIPTGGEVKFTVPQIEIRDIKPGVSRFPVASNVTFTQFVMGGTISWSTLSEGNGGCGIAFNDAGDQSYTLAYVNTDGEYGVSQRVGDSFDSGIYGMGIATDANRLTFTLIVYGEQIQYYVDNLWVGQMPYTATEGEISTAIVNFDGVDTTCNFNDLWLWNLDPSD